MDAEKAHQLLRERLRCQILEADKESESIRADKYLNIIMDTLARHGEDGSCAIQPEASRILATKSFLARPKFPGDGSSGPVEALTIAQRQPEAVDPPVVGRKRDPSSAENSESARSSKRTRHFSNVPQSTTLKPPCDTRMSAPRDRFGVDVEGIIERSGFTPLSLTRAEAARVRETPGIGWKDFIKLFGGTQNSEWPQCFKVPGYENFICTTAIAQPFMPLSPGKPGLLIRLPSFIETPQSDRDRPTYHILSASQPGGTMYYLGEYAVIPLPKIQFTWTRVSYTLKDRWIKRITFRNSLDMREIRARIELRNKTEREPSVSEVKAHMRHQFRNQVSYAEVSAALRSGKEKFSLMGVECVRYDSHLAEMIQRAVYASDT